MKPQTTTPYEQATLLNPIIGLSPTDTLVNAAYVASFLTRLQLDQADWKESSKFGPDPLSAEEARGLGFLTETLAAALWFEVQGRQGDEGGQS
ncbi:MAG: hypothetical protein PHW25_00520 [Zoogloea sp.]|jgi:hypothetical protein|uniref:hypothetical protein n=1 Tax=Zoogloea TaxID=349 RepID=UPI00262EEEBC|nr:hypothetical protein [Zoogloea sp.]MDD3325552.1 hypothetical protein [Zoogloea sp.]